MSSNIKWGGIAGVVAAALVIVSAILDQLSPLQRTYDSAASYLYLGVVVAAYVAVIICRPRDSRLAPREVAVRPAGDRWNGAHRRWLLDHDCR
jgi:hypothetical protein